MVDKKINLKKVIGNLGENIFPNIEYFMNDDSINPEGNVDGSNDGLYQGLVRGEGLDELNIDENISNNKDSKAIFCTCSKSGCNKKYCDCYKENKKCNIKCKYFK